MVVVINNAGKAASIEFDATPAGLAGGHQLIDRLNAGKEVRVENGKLKVTLPARSAALFVPR